MKKVVLSAFLFCYAVQGLVAADVEKKENTSWWSGFWTALFGAAVVTAVVVDAVDKAEQERPVKLVEKNLTKNIDGSLVETRIYYFADTGEYAYTKTEQILASDYERALQQLASDLEYTRRNKAEIELAKRQYAAILEQENLDKQRREQEAQERQIEAESRRLKREKRDLDYQRAIVDAERAQLREQDYQRQQAERAAQQRINEAAYVAAQQKAAQEAYNCKLEEQARKDRETEFQRGKLEEQRQKDKDRQKLADDARAKDEARRRQEQKDADFARQLARQEAGTLSTTEALVVQRVAEQSLAQPKCSFCVNGKCKGNVRKLSCGCYACDNAGGICQHGLKL